MNILHPVDRLIMDESTPWAGASRVTVLDDVSGALAAAAAQRNPQAHVRAYCDSLVDEIAVRRHCESAGVPVDIATDLTTALDGADLVLARLPRSVDGVGAMAEQVAVSGSNEVALVAAARTKHMTPAMNPALATGFHTVRASRGRFKSRALLATGPRPDATVTWPRSENIPEAGFEVYAHAGVFAGARLDRGTRVLLSWLENWEPAKRRTGRDLKGPVLDLGCGTGILAGWLSKRLRTHEVVASDVSTAAIASAQLTVGDSVEVLRRDSLGDWEPESLGAIVTNPPFHIGAAKESTPTLHMIDDSARVLHPGGELIMVFNTHLPYLPRLRKVGPTEIVRRDPHYLVTRTVRQG